MTTNCRVRKLYDFQNRSFPTEELKLTEPGHKSKRAVDRIYTVSKQASHITFKIEGEEKKTRVRG